LGLVAPHTHQRQPEGEPCVLAPLLEIPVRLQIVARLLIVALLQIVAQLQIVGQRLA